MQVATALAAVTGALPAAEDRPGQKEMAQAVADAIHTKRHLVVQAGTGTGKTIGYLVPAIPAGKTVVVATATKALQDQLAGKDLPFLQAHLGKGFEWAVLKGRSNYLCTVSYTHLRAHETVLDLVCRLLLEKKNKKTKTNNNTCTRTTLI